MRSSLFNGFGGPILLAVLGLLIVVGGVIYYGSRQLEPLPPGAYDWPAETRVEPVVATSTDMATSSATSTLDVE